jgi:thiamine-monophosphate kinase
MKISDLGEARLLQRLFPFCIAGSVGDDGAVLTIPPTESLVVTTDVLVDGVHFSDRTTSAADVGWRAAAANLSDLAAMGARPLGITVGLSLPPTTRVDWVEELYSGIESCLQHYQTGIVGGDVCRSPVISVAITALGTVRPAQAIRRDRARPDSAILVTGYHGKSRAGLELLLNPETGKGLGAIDLQDLIISHQRPRPRLDVLPLLEKLQPAWIAGMDSSDGLLDAITQICRASGVGAAIDRQLLPVSPSLQALRPDPLDWIMTGGEDFELVLCLPPNTAEALVQQLGNGSAIVGYTTVATELWLTNGNDDKLPLESNYQSFQHF